MELYCQYIQEQMMSRNNFYINNHNFINAVLDVISYYLFSLLFLLFVYFSYVLVLSL
jgi:hypothetical protein